MPDTDPKDDLRHYLQRGREALLWKLEGLSDYDIRRPLVPTGTNLLGLVKHVSGIEAGYLGASFGRPFEGLLPGQGDDTEPQDDMWATAEETRDQLTALYRRVWEHSDATIAALPLDTIGRVPWWPPEHQEITLHRVLVHMISETERHAGHADLVRELIDGSAGVQAGNTNLPDGDAQWWQDYRDRLEQIARKAL